MAGKSIRDYVKYTFKELEEYTRTKNSCVKKITEPIHVSVPPYAMVNFKGNLQQIIAEQKIGSYDDRLKGIVLDIRKIKVLTDTAAFRFDDPTIHLNIMADCYVFQPKIGAIIQGLVKHISAKQIGVIIYRVFSVSIQLDRIDESIKINSEIEFRIVNFDLQNVMPYIKGELIAKEISESDVQFNKVSASTASREQPDNIRNTSSFLCDSPQISSDESDSGHESEDTDMKRRKENLKEKSPEKSKETCLHQSSESDMFAGLYSQENDKKVEMLSPNRSIDSSSSSKHKRKKTNLDSKLSIEDEEETDTVNRTGTEFSAIRVKRENVDEGTSNESNSSPHKFIESPLHMTLKNIKIEKDLLNSTPKITKDDNNSKTRSNEENTSPRKRKSNLGELNMQPVDKLKTVNGNEDLHSEDLSDSSTDLINKKLSDKSHKKATSSSHLVMNTVRKIKQESDSDSPSSFCDRGDKNSTLNKNTSQKRKNSDNQNSSELSENTNSSLSKKNQKSHKRRSNFNDLIANTLQKTLVDDDAEKERPDDEQESFIKKKKSKKEKKSSLQIAIAQMMKKFDD